MSHFGIGVGDGRDDVVAGPAPVFRFIAREEVVGDDFRFVIGFVAEGGHAVDVAESPDAVSRRFQELIGFNVAPFIEADVGIFQVEEICRRLDAGGH